MSDEKIPLELNLEISQEFEHPTRLTKVVYAGFVPQHGMRIIDSEIFFRVRTTALAGLQNLKHVGYPIKNGKWVEGDRRAVLKLFPRNESEHKDSIEFFIKQGWKLER